jgi:hypothetical protein
MAVLYVNPKGVAHRKHSYSAGRDFENPYRYYLRRVLGWRESDNRACFKFGRAFEEALQFHHDNNGQGAVDDFVKRWLVFQDVKDLKYTKKEKDWANLNKTGIEMLKLYVIKQPSLPIPLGGQSVFQREYEKEVYPGDVNYGEISMAGKIDIICYTDPEHPMLSKVNWKPEYGVLRPLIVDVKTAGINYHESQGEAAYDKQLCIYSWLTGIRDVSLLWFTKTGHRLEKGSSATLLEDAFGEGFKAGDEVVVAQVTEEGVWIVKNDYFLTVMEEAQGRKPDGKLDTTKAATERKTNWLTSNALRVPESYLTRQRLQFNAGRVSPESAENAGRIAGSQIQQIVNAWKSKTWVDKFDNRPGFGYSNDPYFQAFVKKDEAFKLENFKKSEDENFDDLFVDDPEEE